VSWSPDPGRFLADVEVVPSALRALAERLEDDPPWPSLGPQVSRVVLLGMGSSRFAAGVAASRLRHLGVDAVAEYASADLGHPGGPGTVAIGISASGATEETVTALRRHAASGSEVVAVTNAPGSSLTDGADLTVDLAAGTEQGGVACRTFRHTIGVLLALEAHLGGVLDAPGSIRRAADASEDLLARRDGWLPEVAERLTASGQAFLLAPVERLASAEQGALMLREGPRLVADACETGDWLHVDVYLTKPLDYRALLFAGSRFDGSVMGWVAERGATVVAVGADVEGAADAVRYRGDDDPLVALLTEVLVPELVAARAWGAQA
jgi:glucosamine 6-phosphate synthetase-like amidotransferase/phosphosugar isomerase protein